MPPRVRRASRPIRRPRRRLEWANSEGSGVAIAAGNYSTFDLLATFAALPGASVVGATVVRTHLRMWVDSAVAAGDNFATGLIVGPNDQTTSVATPTATAHALNMTSEPQGDWMSYLNWFARPGYSFTSPNNCFELDVRSKRRLPELGDTLLWVTEVRTAGAAFSYHYHSRVLLALP